MKKVLIGCGVVLMLGVIVAAIGGVMAVRAIKNIAGQGEQMVKAYDATNTANPFDPEAAGPPTAEQLDRWLAVRRGVLPSVQGFKDTMESVQDRNPFAVIGAVVEEGGAFVDGHAAALGANAMSSDEYFWIGMRVYTALASGDARQDEDLKGLAAEIDKLMRQQGQNNNAAAMYTSLTSAEIVTILEMVKERKETFLETKDVVFADYMIGPILMGIAQQIRIEKERERRREGAEATPESEPAIMLEDDTATSPAPAAP
jgi:hypothetical protein